MLGTIWDTMAAGDLLMFVSTPGDCSGAASQQPCYDDWDGPCYGGIFTENLDAVLQVLPD